MKRVLLALAALVLILMLTAVSFALPEGIDVTCGSTPTVDGIISPGEWTCADCVTFATEGGTCTVYFKHDGTTLYVAFDIPNKVEGSAVQIFLDTDYDRATLPQTDDWRFTISRRDYPDEFGLNQGTGSGWTPWITQGDGVWDGWYGERSDIDSHWNAEFAISYAKLGITAGQPKCIGISFLNCWPFHHYWPDGADWDDPSTWGKACSSDNWACFPVGGILVPVDKFGLLAPYIGVASTILVATAATAIYAKRVKRKKKKQ